MICINIVTLHSSPQRTWDDKARFERQKPDRFRRASPTAWGREGKHSRRVRAGADRLSEAVEGLQQTRSSVWKSPGMDFKFESNLIVCGRRPRITWVVVLGFFVSKILAGSLSLSEHFFIFLYFSLFLLLSLYFYSNCICFILQPFKILNGLGSSTKIFLSEQNSRHVWLSQHISDLTLLFNTL